MIRNIIFDIGGVLAEEVNGRALTHLTTAEQKQISDLIYYKSPGFVEVLLGNKSSADYANEMIAKHPHLEKEISFLFAPKNLPVILPVKRQVLDLLYELHNSYKIYFLSNITDVCYEYLKSTLQCFDGGVYSFREHFKKPDLAFYELLLSRYQINSAESVFFDDREKNVIAARELGMRAEVFVDTSTVTDALEG